MRIRSVRLQIARKLVETFKARITILRTPSRKSRVSSTRTANMSGIRAYLIVGFDVSALTIIASLGALVALILVGLHLSPTCIAFELFRECTIAVLLSELISVLRRTDREEVSHQLSRLHFSVGRNAVSLRYRICRSSGDSRVSKCAIWPSPGLSPSSFEIWCRPLRLCGSSIILFNDGGRLGR
jgi:hypothetical protein